LEKATTRTMMPGCDARGRRLVRFAAHLRSMDRRSTIHAWPEVSPEHRRAGVARLAPWARRAAFPDVLPPQYSHGRSGERAMERGSPAAANNRDARQQRRARAGHVCLAIPRVAGASTSAPGPGPATSADQCRL
jgi:hypothetical protein